MSNRRRTLRKTPVATTLLSTDNTTPNFIEVCVSYKEGGTNPRSFIKQARGYYLSASPKNIGKPSNGTFTTSVRQFSSPTVLVEQAKRFGQKKLDSIAPNEAMIDQLIAQVMIANNLKFITIREPLAA